MNLLATFGNLFSGDGVIIFLILLLLFGAKKLPELARGLGSAVREFSKAKDEIHHEMTRPSDPPQTPQIEAPKYTEPHVAASTGAHGFSTPADVHAPEPVMASPVTPQPGVYGSAEMPIPTPITEEHQNHPPLRTV